MTTPMSLLHCDPEERSVEIRYRRDVVPVYYGPGPGFEQEGFDKYLGRIPMGRFSPTLGGNDG